MLVGILAALLALTTGCTSVGGAPDFGVGGSSGSGGSGLPSRPRAAPQSGGDLLASADLHTLYQALIDSYVDPVDPGLLINGAVRGTHQASVQAGLLPMESGIFDTATLRLSSDADGAWNQWSQIYNTFLRKLLNRIDVRGIGQGAAKGMLDALHDPNTTFMTRGDLQALQISDYVGVGVVLAPTGARGSPVVREVTPGSPADSSGLGVGDLILAVGGKTTDSLTLSETVDAIRGTAGTEVALTIRSPRSVAREVSVRRGVVRSASVNTDLRSGVGYVRVRALQEGTSAAVRTALVQAPSGTRGWVLDLRGNDKGSLQEAVNVASLFVGDGVVAFQEDRTNRRAAIRGAGRPLNGLAPTVVLVDEGTGGAAEVLTAALRDNGVATVVGSQTAGRAARTMQVPLSDGSVAQITSQRLVSPSGQPLNRIGLKPEDLIIATADDWISGHDVQLDRALAKVGA
ncbi:MAG: PDZ domain-containing protein [Chloroflexi bacterium]|nr:PDZ domain-containing protein [Chloroflexota bacterium]